MDYIKRVAKSIKKSQNISHTEALNKASISCGFQNWNHFLNLSKNVSKEKTTERSSRDIAEVQLNKEILSVISPQRNLLMAGLNELIKKESFKLDLQKNEDTDEHGHLFVDILGYPSVVLWREIGFQEVEISVWWKYNHSLHPQANLTGNSKENFRTSEPLADRKYYKKFVGAVIVGWLERREGKFLQGKGNEGILKKYVRRGEKTELENAPLVDAIGFEPTGLFYV
ncbi:hypothetical protein [Sphingobacterium sp. JUb56]|uniref:hypothetical protein n=1 Tax=Sphingobacterium sp. JUb56 TaxID=2587145 RepID=UPI0018243C31|nr:hypothetical protein [Sphingobacterium sp. JUb56]MBB2951148.1 hypothetical protein [Sphingobacterium sp. JUb56]